MNNRRFCLWVVIASIAMITWSYFNYQHRLRETAEQQELKRMMELLLEKDGKK